MAGPDLSDLSLFNHNNRTIVSHALLNRYDTMLSAHETTFHAFCQIMTREYEMYASPEPFMSEDTFLPCWFSFMRLQPCDDSFTCPLCGPAPRVVIIDGVTAGFRKRMQTTTLRPPTCRDDRSAVHEDVKPPKRPLQLVPNLQLRKQAIALVRWALPGGKSASEEQDMTIDHDLQPETAPSARSRVRVTSSNPPFKIAEVAQELKKINPTLASVFQEHVHGRAESKEQAAVANLWRELLLQVR